MEGIVGTLSDIGGEKIFAYAFLLLVLLLPGATNHIVFGYDVPSDWPVFITFCMAYSFPFLVCALVFLNSFPKILGFKREGSTGTEQVFYVALGAILLYYLVLLGAYLLSLLQSQFSMEGIYSHITWAVVGFALLLMVIRILLHRGRGKPKNRKKR